ncbi:hypothetical protein [Paraburkholderia terrae]|nr:hypothetical protein [Paraburkholderia terrae]
MSENPHARRNRSEFAHGPVAQDADNFLVVQQAIPDPLAQQAGRDVVWCTLARFPSFYQKTLDIGTKFDGHPVESHSVSRQCGFPVFADPVKKRRA